MGFFDAYNERRLGQPKGGWRCSLCNITYPNNRDKHTYCLACNDRCDYMSNAEVDVDWVEKAAELVERWEGGNHDKPPDRKSVV